MKKTIYSLSLISILVLGLTACSTDDKTSSVDSTAKEEKHTSSAPLTEKEFEKMISDPESYVDSTVEFYGTIFTTPEKDDNLTAFQVWDKDDNNLIVGIEDAELDVEMDDIVKIKGVVTGAYEGENAFGGTIIAPTITASSIEVTDYATAFAPAIKTYEVNQEQNQSGYILKLEKVEIAEKETRAYIEITNNTQDEISFYSFDSKLISGSTQLEEERNYNYPDIPSDILPGITTQGIVTFPVLKDENGKIILYFEGSSNNWDLDIEPFKFEVTLN